MEGNMRKKEMEESKINQSHNTRKIWTKVITCVLVVGFSIFFDLFSPNYSSYSSSGAYNPAIERENECKRAFPEQNVNVVLYNRYPGCYQNPQV